MISHNCIICKKGGRLIVADLRKSDTTKTGILYHSISHNCTVFVHPLYGRGVTMAIKHCRRGACSALIIGFCGVKIDLCILLFVRAGYNGSE